MSLESFLEEFNASERTIRETLSEVTINLKSNGFDLKLFEEFEESISFINSRDRLQISVIVADDDSIEFYSGQTSKLFVDKLSQRFDIKEDYEDIFIHITINKEFADGVVSVYNLENFSTYLNKLSLEGIIDVLGNALSIKNYLVFESQIDNINLKTKSIWFITISEKINEEPTSLETLKKERINGAKSLCHFNLVSSYNLIPEDFHVLEPLDNNIATLFEKLTVVYSMAFLFDIVSITGSMIEYKLNGYKSFKSQTNFDLIDKGQASNYFLIYQWCYISGSLNDKVGLSRNIISLNFIQPTEINLKENVFQAIQSSYKVYEKQNIKQYIEIRNKISDQLLSFNDRANKIIETFASGFQKSALALITFFISAIAIKLLAKGEFLSVFSLDATILSIAFIACSLIYFLVARWEVNEQRERFVKSYNNLKNRNRDLLDEEDIKRILNDDRDFNEDLNFIDSKKKIYSRMWVSFLVILLSTTVFLFLIYNLTEFLNTGLWQLLYGSCRL